MSGSNVCPISPNCVFCLLVWFVILQADRVGNPQRKKTRCGFFFFFFGHAHSMWKFPRPRDQTRTTAVTQAPTVTMPDPLPAALQGNSHTFLNRRESIWGLSHFVIEAWPPRLPSNRPVIKDLKGTK